MAVLVCIAYPSLAQFRQANSVEDANKNGYSDLWGKNGENWMPSGRLPDVSFCGYNMGYTETPNYEVKATLGQNGAAPNDGKNDAKELQSLINTIVTPGAIKIPTGVWNIDERIYINRSGVVLLGEDGAEFKMNKSLREIDNATGNDYAFNDAFFIFGSNISMQAKNSITKDANHGANTIQVENGVTYSPGDWLNIVQTDDTNESLFQYVTGSSEKRSFWDLNGKYKTDPILYLQSLFHLIAKVEKQEGDVVTLNRTLPLDIKTKWKPTVAKIDKEASIQNCGIENVKIRMNGKAFVGHFNMDGSSAFELTNVLNCWIKNVELFDIDNGIVLNQAYYCTFDSITVSLDKRIAGTDTGHHGFWCNLRSSDNLFSNITINTTFLHDFTVEGVANGNVFSQCSGQNLNFDHHRGAPYSNVFTELNVGKGSRLFGSSGSWYRGPHTGRYTTVWNIKKNTGVFGGLPNKSNTGSLGKISKDWYYINCIGANGAKISDLAEHRNQYVEFSNNETLKARNIFLAQRAKRFNLDTLKSPDVNFTSPNNGAVFTIGSTIDLVANATDENGIVTKVVFVINDADTIIDYSIPFESSFTPLTTGIYSVIATAFDNENNRTNAYVTFSVVNEKVPYKGVPFTIPGTIEAEDFDIGGQGGSYNDMDPENKGGEYRLTEGVDVVAGGTGFSVGYTGDGEWLEYTIDVAQTGEYDVIIHYSAGRAGARIGLELPKKSIALIPSLDLLQTANWDEYKPVIYEKVTLSTDDEVLRVNIVQAGFNIDKIELIPSFTSSVSTNFSNEKVIVYPNPSYSGIFNLTAITKWKVYSIQGSLLVQGHSKQLDLSSYGAGIYFILINGSTHKLIVK